MFSEKDEKEEKIINDNNDFITQLKAQGFDTDSNLSELIHACGDDFSYLDRNSDGTFTAQGYPLEPEYQGNGKNPEEAVAHLLLALKAN